MTDAELAAKVRAAAGVVSDFDPECACRQDPWWKPDWTCKACGNTGALPTPDNVICARAALALVEIQRDVRERACRLRDHAKLQDMGGNDMSKARLLFGASEMDDVAYAIAAALRKAVQP